MSELVDQIIDIVAAELKSRTQIKLTNGNKPDTDMKLPDGVTLSRETRARMREKISAALSVTVVPLEEEV